MTPLSRSLSIVELRVLGALIEKEITTPEYYPLSLNALLNACNQKSSRDPVLELSQRDVLAALDELETNELTVSVHDGRVAKYEHRIRTVLQLRRDETALMCLLLLRGPQTGGELRSRADRLYAFDDLAAVTATLERLASRPGPDSELMGSSSQPATGPLIIMLPRQAGAREARYAHLLGGPVEANAQSHPVTIARSAEDSEALIKRVLQLEQTIHALETRVANLEGAALDRNAGANEPV